MLENFGLEPCVPKSFQTIFQKTTGITKESRISLPATNAQATFSIAVPPD